MKKWILLCSIFCCLAFFSVRAGPPDDAVPSVQDVVGDLIVPYSGPMQVLFDGDVIVFNVGGNISHLAYSIIGEQVDLGRSIVGMGTLNYDDFTGILNVVVGDFYFEMQMQIEMQKSFSDIFSGNDCPENRKCCTCEGQNGGSATATCLENERPICTCQPCCSSTCVKVRSFGIMR